MSYKHVQAGEWIAPVRKGYKLQCCDCGLIHRVDFRLMKRGKGRVIIFRAFRHNRPMGMTPKELKKLTARVRAKR
jgi:hypothetical protein